LIQAPASSARGWSSGSALAAYIGVSALYFGVPIAVHPGRDLIGAGVDPEIFIWSLAWWPHAILHWENPIVSHAIWAPGGVNLAWATSIPGLALLAAPVTLLAGPTFAYNLIAVLLPSLAAWTAFLLCRHVTRSFWPSLAGGYLFGFSSYELGQTEGHMHLTSVFLVPLVALVLLRFVEGSLSRRRFVVELGLLLAFQLSFSTEVSLMLAFTIAVALVVAWAAVPSARRSLRRLLLPLGAAYALTAVLTSPLLVYAFLHFQGSSINPPASYPADLLNVVVPTRLTWISWHWTKAISDDFRGNSSENGVYLGLPALAILVWFAWAKRRQPAARFLAIVLALGVLVELGTALHVRGHRYATLPWGLIAHLPAFDNVLPVRFSLFVALGAAVAVAWWAASSGPPPLLRVVLPVAAIVTIAPSLWLSGWHDHPWRPSFFVAGMYRACLQPEDNVLMLPFPVFGDSMLWQAEAGFRFRMANGFVSPVLPDNVPDPEDAANLRYNEAGSDWRPVIRFATAQRATIILVDSRRSVPWKAVLDPLTKPTAIGDVYLYNMPGRRSPCTS
jgi:hypothetical protein